MLPAESIRFINFPNQTTGASANLAQQTHVALNKDQSGPNYVSSANNFISSVPSPFNLTSVSQNYNNHNRSVDFTNISQFSYFSGINPALAENPIFYIFKFQGPRVGSA